MKKRIIALMFVAALALGCVACGKTESKTDSNKKTAKEDKKVIKLGVRDSSDAIDVCKKEIEKAGYKVEVTVFDDSIQPNVALGEGSIDINWYQHEPYLEAYNAENGTDFVMVEPKTAAPLFAMYSDKIKSVDEIKDGATIGLCNDAANQARGLRLLEHVGLIKLDESVETPTKLDIKENKKNLKFIETDMQVLPQSLPDVDAIVLAAAHMANAGLDAQKYVAASDDAETFAVGFVVRKEDKDAEWATGLAKAVQCDELAKYYKEVKQGTMVPMWK
ncbi:D-methionine transport system substrate-binding protein [Lachnospiraceae bacterium XBB1006]|nr:D-methionine transport system substrate-binding protein [Lachnospiraceae bacterium XBB1006]